MHLNNLIVVVDGQGKSRQCIDRSVKHRASLVHYRLLLIALLTIFLIIINGLGKAHAQEKSINSTPSSLHDYYTGGVHNDFGCIPPQKCIYKRGANEPTNPLYPKWWVSDWVMYRVFQNYDKFPPPYASPPEGLTPADYEVSYGSTYYDDTYVPADHDGHGAMMEHYEKRCLPIFPSSNQYSCSFVSLGNKAYFLRYEDRPAGTPQCCQFSLHNHPPRIDFITHLPYNADQSSHLDGSIQAYSRLVPPGILFGYAFYRTPTRDSSSGSSSGTAKEQRPYRHPQSFFFSGSPTDPPNAPIVSQNYTNFRAQQPAAAETWAQVAKMCPAQPQWCCLFETDCPNKAAVSETKNTKTAKPAPSWSTLEQ